MEPGDVKKLVTCQVGFLLGQELSLPQKWLKGHKNRIVKMVWVT